MTGGKDDHGKGNMQLPILPMLQRISASPEHPGLLEQLVE